MEGIAGNCAVVEGRAGDCTVVEGIAVEGAAVDCKVPKAKAKAPANGRSKGGSNIEQEAQ